MRIIEVGEEPFQRITIIFQESEVILSLRFLPTVQEWVFSASYKEFNIYGVKLALATPHMVSSNQPFDFIVQDNSDSGLDPFRVSDFSDGRCTLYLLEPEDMEQLRGVPVEI